MQFKIKLDGNPKNFFKIFKILNVVKNIIPGRQNSSNQEQSNNQEDGRREEGRVEPEIVNEREDGGQEEGRVEPETVNEREDGRQEEGGVDPEVIDVNVPLNGRQNIASLNSIRVFTTAGFWVPDRREESGQVARSSDSPNASRELSNRTFKETMFFQKKDSNPFAVEVLIASDKKSKGELGENQNYVKGKLTAVNSGSLEGSVNSSTLKDVFFKLCGKGFVKEKNELQVVNQIVEDSHENAAKREILKNREIEEINNERFVNHTSIILVFPKLEIIQVYFSQFLGYFSQFLGYLSKLFAPMNFREVSLVKKIFAIAYVNPLVIPLVGLCSVLIRAFCFSLNVKENHPICTMSMSLSKLCFTITALPIATLLSQRICEIVLSRARLELFLQVSVKANYRQQFLCVLLVVGILRSGWFINGIIVNITFNTIHDTSFFIFRFTGKRIPFLNEKNKKN